MSKHHTLPTDYDYDSSPSYLPKHLDSKAVEVTVTPADAELLLSYTAKNRKISEAHIRELAKDFTNEDWKLNGETVTLGEDANGRPVLMDGQHRLRACVKSGVPMRTFIIRDIPLDAFDTIDSGKRRTLSDVYSAMGYEHSTHLATSLTTLDNYKNKRHEQNKNRRYFHNQEAQKLIAQYPDMPISLEFLSGMFSVVPVPVAIIACAHYLFSEIDRTAADEFMIKFVKGISIDDTDPIYHLREMMIRHKMSKAARERTSACWDRIAQLAGLITTWNKFRLGQSATRSPQMWYPGKSSFPKPRS